MIRDTHPCASVREHLPLHVSGDLPDANRRDLGEHLSECEHCTRELSDHERLRSWLGDLSPSAPADRAGSKVAAVDPAEERIRLAVLDAVAAEGAPWSSGLRYLAAAAAIVLALGLGWLLNRTRTPVPAADRIVMEPLASHSSGTPAPWSLPARIPAPPAAVPPTPSGPAVPAAALTPTALPEDEATVVKWLDPTGDIVFYWLADGPDEAASTARSR